MKIPTIDIKIKKLAQSIYYNAVRLFEDACVNYGDNSLGSAYFLALCSIEEIGKVVMVDHYYADMRLNNECLNIPKEEFLKDLFKKNNFYNHKSKHRAALDVCPVRIFSGNYEAREKYFVDIDQERMRALYVDWSSGQFSIPNQYVTREKVEKALEICLEMFKSIEDMGLEGSYWKAERGTQAEYKKIISRLQKVYHLKLRTF